MFPPAVVIPPSMPVAAGLIMPPETTANAVVASKPIRDGISFWIFFILNEFVKEPQN
jgi:hypothetical protein